MIQGKNAALKKNIFANFFGVAVQVFNQIALVPLYLHFWDVPQYGDWIILTAVSSFFALSDVGLNSVTINQFVIKYTEGKKEECLSLLTNNNILILSVLFLSLGSCILFALTNNLVTVLNLHAVSRFTANYVFICLIIFIFLGMLSSVWDTIYRANSLNHKSVYLWNLVRLAEGLILMFSLLFKVSMPLMVSFYLIPRIFSFFYKKYDTKKYFFYQFDLKHWNFILFKKTLLPSLTFMSFPVGNAIIYQGFSLLINKYFGASPLVLFNTTRTLTNFVRTTLDTMQFAVWPEYSIAFGRNDIYRMRELHRNAFFVASTFSVLLSLFILINGAWIYKVWTHGRVTFDFYIMLAFLIILIIKNIWTTSSVTLMATNKHSSIGILYIILSVVSIALAYLTQVIQHSVIVMIYCQLAIEIPLSLYALKQGFDLTQDTFTEFKSNYIKIWLDIKTKGVMFFYKIIFNK